jgi:haloacetate dehalogenase
MFDGFSERTIETGECDIFVRIGGTGPPILLLHGFPQTHIMWRGVAPILARHFTTVCADLRGYGRSSCPPSTPDHSHYAKRAMARDMVGVMAELGFDRFAVAGHDRGGRVAYRMALDWPENIARLAVLDVIPTASAWDLADARLAIGFWPWSLLAQAEPLPERLLRAAPDAVIDDALSNWGSAPAAFPPEVRAEYIAALSDDARVHAICEEYRAAASLDRDHDAADLANRRKIAAPTLVLWSALGGLDSWYADRGGPVEIWREWCTELSGGPMDAGHFMPEEAPEEVASILHKFFDQERDAAQ